MGLLTSIVMNIRPAPLGSFLKKILLSRRKIYVASFGTFFIDPCSHFGFHLSKSGHYEQEMEFVIDTLLSKGDNFLDLGANEGYFSILASKRIGPEGLVIAVEPQSRLQPILFMNIQLNDAYNVHVRQIALSDANGIATLFLAPDVNTGASGLSWSSPYNTKSEIVPQYTLQALMNSLNSPSIKLVKLDLEGFEHEVIMSSPHVIFSKKIQHIALELHPSILASRGKSSDEIIGLLESAGYKRDNRFKTLVYSLS